VLNLAVRAGNRAKLELIARVPAVRDRIDRQYIELLRRHEAQQPCLPTADGHLVDGLRTAGVQVTTLDAIDAPGTAQLRAELKTLVGELAAQPAADQQTLRLPLDRVLEASAVWQWGLSNRLLDLAETYLGLPARYYGADLRREVATGQAVGVRQWHRDVEDHRMLKILVWLNDVDADGGPFQYVDRSHTDRLSDAFRYVSGFVDDARFAAGMPRDEWRSATGPTWTAVVADTRSVFHRATPPVARDRYSVTFSYTSRVPLTTLPVPPVTPAQRALAVAGLRERQLACLPTIFTR
jgi:hypothetical protein